MKSKYVDEARKKYPDKLGDWDDARITQNLSDPAKFRRAFPELQQMSDEDIRREFQEPVDVSEPPGLLTRLLAEDEDDWGITKVAKGFTERGVGLLELPKQTALASIKSPDDEVDHALENLPDFMGMRPVAKTLKAFVADPARQAFQTSRREAERGNTAKSMFYSVTAGIPLLGPAANSIYEMAESGKTGRALGAGLFDAATMGLTTPRGMQAVGQAGRFGGRVIRDAKLPTPYKGMYRDRVATVRDTMTQGQKYAAAKEAGVQPNLAQASESPYWRGRENAVESNAGGSQRLGQHQEQAQRDWLQAVEDLKNGIGSSTDVIAAGNRLRRMAQIAEEASLDNARHGYKALDDFPQAQKVPTKWIKQAAEKVLTEVNKANELNPSLASSQLTQLLDEMRQYPMWTSFENLHRVRSRLGKAIFKDDPVMGESQKFMNDIRQAIDDSMTRAAVQSGNTRYLQAFRDAQAGWAKHMDDFASPDSPFRTILDASNDTTIPLDTLLSASGKGNVRAAKMFNEYVRDGQLRGVLQRSFLDRLTDKTGHGFRQTPDLLPNRLGQYSEPYLRELFQKNPEALQKLIELGEVERGLNFDHNPTGSGTRAAADSAVRTMGTGVGATVAGLATGEPLTGLAAGAAILGVPPLYRNIMSRALTSEKLTDYLMGYEGPGGGSLLDEIRGPDGPIPLPPGGGDLPGGGLLSSLDDVVNAGRGQDASLLDEIDESPRRSLLEEAGIDYDPDGLRPPRVFDEENPVTRNEAMADQAFASAGDDILHDNHNPQKIATPDEIAKYKRDFEGKIFSEEELRDLVEDGILSNDDFEKITGRPIESYADLNDAAETANPDVYNELVDALNDGQIGVEEFKRRLKELTREGYRGSDEAAQDLINDIRSGEKSVDDLDDLVANGDINQETADHVRDVFDNLEDTDPVFRPLSEDTGSFNDLLKKEGMTTEMFDDIVDGLLNADDPVGGLDRLVASGEISEALAKHIRATYDDFGELNDKIRTDSISDSRVNELFREVEDSIKNGDRADYLDDGSVRSLMDEVSAQDPLAVPDELNKPLWEKVESLSREELLRRMKEYYDADPEAAELGFQDGRDIAGDVVNPTTGKPYSDMREMLEGSTHEELVAEVFERITPDQAQALLNDSSNGPLDSDTILNNLDRISRGERPLTDEGVNSMLDDVNPTPLGDALDKWVKKNRMPEQLADTIRQQYEDLGLEGLKESLAEDLGLSAQGISEVLDAMGLGKKLGTGEPTWKQGTVEGDMMRNLDPETVAREAEAIRGKIDEIEGYPRKNVEEVFGEIDEDFSIEDAKRDYIEEQLAGSHSHGEPTGRRARWNVWQNLEEELLGRKMTKEERKELRTKFEEEEDF